MWQARLFSGLMPATINEKNARTAVNGYPYMPPTIAPQDATAVSKAYIKDNFFDYGMNEYERASEANSPAENATVSDFQEENLYDDNIGNLNQPEAPNDTDLQRSNSQSRTTPVMQNKSAEKDNTGSENEDDYYEMLTTLVQDALERGFKTEEEIRKYIISLLEGGSVLDYKVVAESNQSKDDR
jgi:hypothetical protein